MWKISVPTSITTVDANGSRRTYVVLYEFGFARGFYFETITSTMLRWLATFVLLTSAHARPILWPHTHFKPLDDFKNFAFEIVDWPLQVYATDFEIAKNSVVSLNETEDLAVLNATTKLSEQFSTVQSSEEKAVIDVLL